MIKKITWLFGRFVIGLGLSFLIWMIVQQDVKAEFPRKVTTEATSTISVETTTSLSPVATETIPIETTLTPLPLMAPVAYETAATTETPKTTATTMTAEATASVEATKTAETGTMITMMERISVIGPAKGCPYFRAETSSTAEATPTISVETTTSLSPVATETIPIETTLTPLPLMAPVAYETTATAITNETTATGTMAVSAVNPTPGQPPSIREQALAAAQKYGIPQKIFFALINQESGWDYKSYSSAGAIGLTQVMPFNITAMGYDVETFKNSPAIQLDLGARFLSDQYKTFARWDLALAAYNAGPGAVKKYGGIPPYRETINYVRSILAMAK